MSQSDPSHLIQHEPFLGAVIELGPPWALLGGHFLRVLQPAAIREIGVMPLARKVWQPIGAAMPAAARAGGPCARRPAGINLSGKTLLLCPRARAQPTLRVFDSPGALI